MTDWNRTARIRRELIEYLFNVIYLAVVFAAFTVYQRLVLAAHDIIHTNYGIALIEALILGKVIMIGGLFRLGHGLEDKPLVYPTLYKTIAFTLLVALFKVFEHAIKALLTGEGLVGGLTKLATEEVHFLLANSLVVLVALFPFFAIKEMGRVLGGNKVWNLFFRRREVEQASGQRE